MRLSIDPSTDPGEYEFVHRIRVRFVETDAMGIVHHSNYLHYFEEARVAYLRHIGHPHTEHAVHAHHHRIARFDQVGNTGLHSG